MHLVGGGARVSSRSRALGIGKTRVLAIRLAAGEDTASDGRR